MQLAPSLRRPAWSPAAIAWLAIFCSFVPAGILYALNWGRLGRRRWEGALVALVLLLTLACGVATAMGQKGVFPDVSVAAAVIFWATQKGAYARHLQRESPRASMRWPIVLGILCQAAIFAAILAPVVQRSRLFNRAVAAFDAGDLPRAEELYRAYARKAPDDPSLHWNRELLYERARRWDEAVAEAEWLAARDYRNSRERLALVLDRRTFHEGVLRADRGDTAAAVRIFEQFQERHPDDPNSYNNLAWLYLDQRKPREARAQLEKLQHLDPGYPSLTDLVAHVEAAESLAQR